MEDYIECFPISDSNADRISKQLNLKVVDPGADSES